MDRRAVTVGALLTTAAVLGSAYLGAGFLSISVAVTLSGAVTGYISRNFRSEFGDAAIAVAIGSAISLVLVLLGTGVIFPKRIYPSSTRGIPGWLLLYGIIGVPIYAAFGALGGRYGAKVKHQQ